MQKIHITIAYATPEKQIELPLELEAYATISIAIKKSGVLDKFPNIRFPEVAVGIWGKKKTLDCPVRDGDRVEIYRPLTVDPKEARRRRV